MAMPGPTPQRGWAPGGESEAVRGEGRARARRQPAVWQAWAQPLGLLTTRGMGGAAPTCPWQRDVARSPWSPRGRLLDSPEGLGAPGARGPVGGRCRRKAGQGRPLRPSGRTRRLLLSGPSLGSCLTLALRVATDALVQGTSTPTPGGRGGRGQARAPAGPSTAKPARGHGGGHRKRSGPRVLSRSLPAAGSSQPPQPASSPRPPRCARKPAPPGSPPWSPSTRTWKVRRPQTAWPGWR